MSSLCVRLNRTADQTCALFRRSHATFGDYSYRRGSYSSRPPLLRRRLLRPANVRRPSVADRTPVLLRCSVVDSAPTADVRRPSVADCTPVALRFSVVFRCSAPDCNRAAIRCSVIFRCSAPNCNRAANRCSVIFRCSAPNCNRATIRCSVIFRCSAPNCNRAAIRCSVIFRCSAPDCNRAALRCYVADRTPIVHCCSIVDSALTKESRRSCANISSSFHHATKTPLITTRQNLHQ